MAKQIPIGDLAVSAPRVPPWAACVSEFQMFRRCARQFMFFDCFGFWRLAASASPSVSPLGPPVSQNFECFGRCAQGQFLFFRLFRVLAIWQGRLVQGSPLGPPVSQNSECFGRCAKGQFMCLTTVSRSHIVALTPCPASGRQYRVHTLCASFLTTVSLSHHTTLLHTLSRFRPTVSPEHRNAPSVDFPAPKIHGSSVSLAQKINGFDTRAPKRSIR